METPDSILDHPAISGCYLFPQDRGVADPFMIDVDGVLLACYLQIVDPDRFTMVHFHGNGEAVDDYVPWMADAIASLGLNALFVEYRQYGSSTGKAQLVAMLGDGEAVIKAAGIPFDKVIAFGRSIGSLYAIELASRQPSIAGMILESGIANPAERFLARANLSGTSITEPDVIAAARRYFDHEQKLSNYANPLLILHTEHDGLVDVSHAERNYRWAVSPEKKLIRFPVGNHNSIMGDNQDQYFQAIYDFVKPIIEPRP